MTISFTRNCLFASHRFLHVSVAIIKELLRPVSESQSLFTRNCWLWKGSFLLLLEKMTSDEDDLPSDNFAERYRHYDLLYAKKAVGLKWSCKSTD